LSGIVSIFQIYPIQVIVDFIKSIDYPSTENRIDTTSNINTMNINPKQLNAKLLNNEKNIDNLKLSLIQ